MSKLFVKKFFISALVLSFSIYYCGKLKLENKSKYENLIITITYNYFGIDAAQIEQMITIPLEEKLFQLANIQDIKSISANDKSVCTVTFNKKTDFESIYLQITKLTDELTNLLPSDVQKPLIQVSQNLDNTIICSIFDCTKETLLSYKYLFDSIPGITEVKISGEEPYQYHISYNNDKSSYYNITPFYISKVIQQNNSSNSLITNIQDQFIYNYLISTEVKDYKKLNDVEIPTNKESIKIKDFTSINKNNPNSNELILLNNKKQTILTLKATQEADWIQISDNYKKIIQTENLKKFSSITIYDKGSEIYKKLIIYIFILLFIFILSCTICFICNKKYCYIFLVIITFSLITTLAIHSSFKIIFTNESIQGIIYYIILFNFIFRTINNDKKLYLLFLSFLLSYFFLFMMKDDLIELLLIFTTTFLMFISSCFYMLLFNFKLSDKDQQNKTNLLIKISSNQILQIVFITLSISLIHFVITKYSNSTMNNILKFSIEYNPEKSINSISTDLNDFNIKLLQLKKLKFIKSEYHRGTAEYELVFNSKIPSTTKDEILKIKTLLKSGTIFFDTKSDPKINEYQLAITGYNIDNCQNYANIIAKEFLRKTPNLQVILNFKQKEKSIEINPQKILLSFNKITVADLAKTERLNINGAIISKKITNGIETDIKLKSDFLPLYENLSEQKININGKIHNLLSIAAIRESSSHSKRYRYNSLPCAYLTIKGPINDSIFFSLVENITDSIILNEGYTLKIINSKTKNKQRRNIVINVLLFYFFINSLLTILFNERLVIKKNFIIYLGIYIILILISFFLLNYIHLYLLLILYINLFYILTLT